MAYILIILIATNIPSASQGRFDSKQACNSAADSIRNYLSDKGVYQMLIQCVPAQ